MIIRGMCEELEGDSTFRVLQTPFQFWFDQADLSIVQSL